MGNARAWDCSKRWSTQGQLYNGGLFGGQAFCAEWGGNAWVSNGKREGGNDTLSPFSNDHLAFTFVAFVGGVC